MTRAIASSEQVLSKIIAVATCERSKIKTFLERVDGENMIFAWMVDCVYGDKYLIHHCILCLLMDTLQLSLQVLAAA